MNDIKNVFFDIDGTLIDMETRVITKRTVESLKRLQEKGILICLATGRPKTSVPNIVGVEFDVYLTFNVSYS